MNPTSAFEARSRTSSPKSFWVEVQEAPVLVGRFGRNDPKGLYKSCLSLLSKEVTQPNLGRIQQASFEEWEYAGSRSARLAQALEAQLCHAENAANERVLECLEGFVDEIVGDIAYVTLKSQSDEVLHGEYPAAELFRLGIKERRRFWCETVEVDGKVEIRLEAIPDTPMSDTELSQLNQELEALVTGGELDGDD